MISMDRSQALYKNHLSKPVDVSGILKEFFKMYFDVCKSYLIKTKPFKTSRLCTSSPFNLHSFYEADFGLTQETE